MGIYRLQTYRASHFMDTFEEWPISSSPSGRDSARIPQPQPDLNILNGAYKDLVKSPLITSKRQKSLPRIWVTLAGIV